MMVVLVDKLLRTEIVQCHSVAIWLFSDTMQKDFTRFVISYVSEKNRIFAASNYERVQLIRSKKIKSGILF